MLSSEGVIIAISVGEVVIGSEGRTEVVCSMEGRLFEKRGGGVFGLIMIGAVSTSILKWGRKK